MCTASSFNRMRDICKPNMDIWKKIGPRIMSSSCFMMLDAEKNHNEKVKVFFLFLYASKVYLKDSLGREHTDL